MRITHTLVERAFSSVLQRPPVTSNGLHLTPFFRPVRPFAALARRASRDVQEAAECFADDLAGGGFVCGGTCFDGGAQLGVEAYGHDFGGP